MAVQRELVGGAVVTNEAVSNHMCSVQPCSQSKYAHSSMGDVDHAADGLSICLDVARYCGLTTSAVLGLLGEALGSLLSSRTKINWPSTARTSTHGSKWDRPLDTSRPPASRAQGLLDDAPQGG